MPTLIEIVLNDPLITSFDLPTFEQTPSCGYTEQFWLRLGDSASAPSFAVLQAEAKRVDLIAVANQQPQVAAIVKIHVKLSDDPLQNTRSVD